MGLKEDWSEGVAALLRVRGKLLLGHYTVDAKQDSVKALAGYMVLMLPIPPMLLMPSGLMSLSFRHHDSLTIADVGVYRTMQSSKFVFL